MIVELKYSKSILDILMNEENYPRPIPKNSKNFQDNFSFLLSIEKFLLYLN